MAGYMQDYSMSVNAVIAYEEGKKPLSKWSKGDILALCGDKAEALKKLTLPELRRALLSCSEWHHTSSHFNATDFYFFDEDLLEEIDEDRIAEIIAARPPKKKKDPNADEIVSAEITYTVWLGQYRNYKRPKTITETVTMKRSDKMVKTSYGNKRVGCLDNIKIL